MLKEIISQLEESYNGDPWFGRSIVSLLSEVEPPKACIRPNDANHSMLEILYHMITWRSFVISRLENNISHDLKYFEEKDWQYLNHGDESLWKLGLDQLHASQKTLLKLLQNSKEEILSEIVPERKYNYQVMLFGFIQHDIYHTGQINYIHKLLK
jgi:uncharacterized damage-inducible protein DinB